MALKARKKARTKPEKPLDTRRKIVMTFSQIESGQHRTVLGRESEEEAKFKTDLYREE